MTHLRILDVNVPNKFPDDEDEVARFWALSSPDRMKSIRGLLGVNALMMRRPSPSRLSAGLLAPA